MSFSRVRTAGLWLDGTTLAGSEMEQFDANLANAFDALNGGAYSLASDVSIGSAPFKVWTFDMTVHCTDTTLFSGAVTFNDDVDLVGADLTFQDGVFTIGASGADAFTVEAFATFNDIVIHNGAEFFNDDVTFAQGFDASGAVLLHDGTVTIGDSGADALTVNAFTTFNGTAGFAGGAYFYSTVSLQGTVTSSGAGYIKARKVSRQAIGADADASYSPISYDHVHVHAGTLGASRDYTIDDTGAVDGDRMEFSTKDVGFAINVKKPGGTQIAQIVGNTHMSCVVARVAGTWTLISYSDYILH